VRDGEAVLHTGGAHGLARLECLENGSLVNPEENIYEYQRYALTTMVVNAAGDMPVDMLFSEGLRQLVEHDRQSQTSYLQTLKALLDNNMSVTATARALFVHRSTLLERLARIKRILGEDLDDPDVRLRLQIVLKALSIQERLASRS
jgi:DNA-binding PucR family transcriptional regulator